MIKGHLDKIWIGLIIFSVVLLIIFLMNWNKQKKKSITEISIFVMSFSILMITWVLWIKKRSELTKLSSKFANSLTLSNYHSHVKSKLSLEKDFTYSITDSLGEVIKTGNWDMTYGEPTLIMIDGEILGLNNLKITP